MMHKFWQSTPRLKSLLRTLLLLPLAVYVLFGFVLYVEQDNFLFLPPPTQMKECSALSDAEVVVSEGTRAYYITSGTSTRIAVLYHGNGESACNSAYLAHWLSVRGYNVLAVEYSGYAGDPSSPSVQLLIGDVEHIQTWLEKMNFSDTLIVGRSVGTGFASYHAKLSSPDKLMLISPFDTLSNVVAVHFPLYPTALMIKTELDNVSNAAFGKDVLIIHGTDDRIVPLQRGQTLFQQLPQKHKTFITINGRAHNDVLSTDQSWAEMESFVR